MGFSIAGEENLASYWLLCSLKRTQIANQILDILSHIVIQSYLFGNMDAEVSGFPY